MNTLADSRKAGSWLVLSPQARLRINLRTMNFQENPFPVQMKTESTPRKRYPEVRMVRTMSEREEGMFAGVTGRKITTVKLPPVKRTRLRKPPEQVPTPRGWTPFHGD